ncbi:protein DpdF [Rhodospirillales bacterium]|nr:protein DpdF [Rhodospirillales bacterium]
MAFDYLFINKIFSEWENTTIEEIKAASPQSTDDELLMRIKLHVMEIKEKGRILSKADFIPLIRQLLLNQKAKNLSDKLTVPTNDGWPTKKEWANSSFQIVETGSQYEIRPKGWRPKWLRGPDRKDDIYLDLLEEGDRDPPPSFSMEWFLKCATGYETYQNLVQREALRSIFLMPLGSTLIVNIPTGSGKTTLAQAEFLTLADRSQVPLTIVAVPTTSLAIDLERRTKDLLEKTGKTRWKNHHFTFYTGMKGQEQVRQTIKKNIRHGTQGILFASPETIVGSFSPALFDAVKSDNLSLFVVDEAHMVCEWGDDFRSEYQVLPGLRRGLLKHCPNKKFRTILMSATLTPSNLDTLEELFGPKDEVQIFSAVSLRREPTYWSNFAESKAKKDERLDEALRHVPRPFILYMSKPEDVKNYTRSLKNKHGYRRIEEFHGGTNGKERERIIKQWQKDEIDGIIANSAFGLGIDKSNVRTVIHGALPETLDRFYQEVGRGGRDGKPSASISIYCDEDISIAKNLAKDSVIGTDRSFERWETMWNQKDDGKTLRNDLFVLDYTIPPKDISQITPANNAWNLKIINSLNRCGMIETDFEPIDLSQTQLFEGSDEEKQELLDKEWKNYHNRIFIRIEDENHLDKEYFAQKLRHLWDDEKNDGEASLEKLQQALNGDQEMGQILSGLYTDDVRGINVSHSCRGCPGKCDRETRRISNGLQYIKPLKQLEPSLCNIEKLSKKDITEFYLFYEEGQLEPNIYELIDKLIKEYGVRYVLFSNTQFKDRVEAKLLENTYFDEILFLGDLNIETNYWNRTIKIPTAQIYYPHETDRLPNTRLDLLNPYPSVSVVPSKIKSHKHDHRLLIEDVPFKNHLSVGEFL